jgi:hypothetical protein
MAAGGGLGNVRRPNHSPPRFSFGGVSEPGVLRQALARSLAWVLGHILPAAGQLLLPSCVSGQGIFIPPFAFHGVCCNVQRCGDARCNRAVPGPQSLDTARVGIYSMARWSTASGMLPSAWKLPRD